jgi:signal transduction histidine kinase
MSTTIRFTPAWVIAIALVVAVCLRLPAVEVAATGNLALTNAAQVRALSSGEAARKLPVQLRGVVVLRDRGSFTLIDETAGVYLETTEGQLPSFGRGDLIEVEGFSDPGKFAPFVKAVAIKKLGAGVIPEPQPVSYDELLMGQFGAQWVEISGVARRSGPLSRDGDMWELWLATGGGQLRVRLPKAQAAAASVDSEVRLRGVCFYQFNLTRQALNPVLTVPRGQPVMVRVPAPVDPYAAPVCSISSLMQFSPGRSYRHRVRVRGCVTHADHGQFWIHDAERGVHIRTRQTDALEVGAEVDVLGFLCYGGYTPLLEDAVFRKVGASSPPLPIHLDSLAEALQRDADLVELEATIQEQWLALDGCRLMLVDGTNDFSALLRLAGNAPAPRDWRPGCRVRVAGICSVNTGALGNTTGTLEPQTFQLLLRSPADLRILVRPPWWTAEHMIWVLGSIVGVLLLVVVIVVWNNRRRLREQALARMKSEAEFSAVWNERNRMARELHDTLAQGLGAISMQLEVVKRMLPADAEVRKPLDEARALARSNLTDARNSIWNMRSQVLETGDLAKALGDILRSLTDGTEMRGELRVLGSPRRLAPMTENNLLRIGQEAITNAARHAQAKRIEVVLQFAPREVQLSVLDDGLGFDPVQPPKSDGGFGLVGMRERAAQMHGELTVSSVPGEGSVLTLALLLPALPDDTNNEMAI